MTRNAKWMWTAAATLAVLVAAGLLWGLRAWQTQRAETAKAETRRAFLARFGIDSDGRSDFIALPAQLPHAFGPAKLGATLFCDRRLAQSAYRTCAACHRLNEGGVDGKTHGDLLTRTVLGASFASVFLHDGSCTNLADAIAQMITRRDRAGGGDLEAVVRRLGADEKLCARFKASYEDGLTTTNLLDALVQHNRTLMPLPTAFDRYWDNQTNAFTAAQVEGQALFRRLDCLSCHDGPMLGGLRAASGRKVPVLRGLGSRGVFLANGSLADLGAVLTRMPVGDLDDAGRAALLAFLKTL